MSSIFFSAIIIYSGSYPFPTQPDIPTPVRDLWLTHRVLRALRQAAICRGDSLDNIPFPHTRYQFEIQNKKGCQDSGVQVARYEVALPIQSDEESLILSTKLRVEGRDINDFKERYYRSESTSDQFFYPLRWRASDRSTHCSIKEDVNPHLMKLKCKTFLERKELLEKIRSKDL